MSESEIVRSGGAAKILGVSYFAIRRACDEGRLPYWTMPGSQHRYFKRADVLRFKRQGFAQLKAQRGAKP